MSTPEQERQGHPVGTVDQRSSPGSLDEQLGQLRRKIIRITKQALFLVLTVVGIPLGVTAGVIGIAKAYTGISKAYGYLTATEWEDRDTKIADTAECDKILERTAGRVLFVYDCGSRTGEWCAKPGEEPVVLHNGISEITFTNYESVTRPKSSRCEGGYKETILERK